MWQCWRQFFTKSPRPPAHWWGPVATDNKPEWEILPQEASKGELILSKRNELGLLSNLAPTPFEFEGVRYASVEALWQMMKFPEGPDDPRRAGGVSWPSTREALIGMSGFEAKHLGDAASALMKQLGVNWVTYKGRRLAYPDPGREGFYQIIRGAMKAKLEQNPEVREVLLATGRHKLRPDHSLPEGASSAHRYYEIWMEIREEIRGQ